MLSLLNKIQWSVDLIPKLSNISQAKKMNTLLEKSDFLQLKYATPTSSTIQTLSMLERDLQSLLESTKSITNYHFAFFIFVCLNTQIMSKYTIIFISTFDLVIPFSKKTLGGHKFIMLALC